mgnify:FL=1
MRQADNPELFTSDEMWENANNAAIADCVFAAAAATYADDSYDFSDANYWLDKYFKETGEDKQAYINEVERLR